MFRSICKGKTKVEFMNTMSMYYQFFLFIICVLLTIYLRFNVFLVETYGSPISYFDLWMLPISISIISFFVLFLGTTGFFMCRMEKLYDKI